MRYRCRNKLNLDYGGRGIGYSDSWEVFETFLSDMGDPPEGASLERLNNDEGYSKENCDWATKKQQANNRRPRTNLKITEEEVVRVIV